MPSHVITVSRHVVINGFDSFFSDGISSSGKWRAHKSHNIGLNYSHWLDSDFPEGWGFFFFIERLSNGKELNSELFLRLRFNDKHKSV